MARQDNSGPLGNFRAELGVWVRMCFPFPGEPRPALFLDRDGVIVEDPGYLSSAADLVLIAGAAETIACANRAGLAVVEVTNQSGIGRGYFGWPEFDQVEAALTRELGRRGAAVDAVLACPYHRNGIDPWTHPDHPARKPRPGMLLAAAQCLNLDLARSWIVGDKLSDLEAGYNAGLRGGLHVLTGHGSKHRQAVIDFRAEGFEVRLGDSIRDAAPIVQLMTGDG
jgi:D-glycero-D-manno-heptose 1,7-bisphosphate phosphatase